MLKFEPLPVEFASDISRENQYRKVRRRIPFAVVQCSGYLSNTPRPNSCAWLILRLINDAVQSYEDPTEEDALEVRDPVVPNSADKCLVGKKLEQRLVFSLNKTGDSRAP